MCFYDLFQPPDEFTSIILDTVSDRSQLLHDYVADIEEAANDLITILLGQVSGDDD